MHSSLKLLVAGILFFAACATPPPPKVLTPIEQIAVDTERARGLSNEFKKRTQFYSAPRSERFLSRMASRLAAASKDFPLEKVEVLIHDDSKPDHARGFSFPGTLISVPLSFLRAVEYENELAAFLAYEIANIMNRHLATRVEAKNLAGKNGSLILFGPGSVFGLDSGERLKSIVLGTDLLYWAGYDVRGMASIFQRYPMFFGKPGFDLDQKEVEFNLREAQKARSDLLPSSKPIVRSSEFIQFKRELGRIH